MNAQHPINALLDQRDLPRFGAFDPSQIGDGVSTLLSEAEAALAKATAPGTPATWRDFVLPLQSATERLGRGWGMVRHLNSVMDSPELRARFNENLPRVTEFWTRLGQNETLFDRYRKLRGHESYSSLDAERMRVIENELRDFRLGGAELKSPARERFAQIQEELAAVQQKFSENILDATAAFELMVTDAARLDGLPEDVLDAAKADAGKKGKEGWRFTLQFPSYLPAMQYAKDRSLREQMYRGYAQRASAGANDNAPLIDRILALRKEKSQLLGFANFAELSLVPKMADTPDSVARFLLDLADRARPFAERDLKELREFAAQNLGLPSLEAWDMAYASEQLQQARYAFSDQEVKRYFQLPRVLEGLFGLVQRMFHVRIRADRSELWHPDVQFYRIETAHEIDGVPAGSLVGQFYLDLFAREHKQSGAWMDDCRGRHLDIDGQTRQGQPQTPVAYLVCNFQPPVGDTPSLLTHDDVTTLFHEFGHGLHHMLTRVNALGVSGIAGVEWDAVELPSQFMENWAWEWDIVESMSRHVETGASMPRALFDKMLAARNFQSGMQTLRQIEFSMFDMEIHRSPAAPEVRKILDAVRDRVAVVKPPAFNRFENSFSHIFSGGYAAGYYSYKWAEVLSADCFAAFEEEGLQSEATGARFLKELLSVGGSRPAIDSFKAFRGREPSIDALLRHSGMVDHSSTSTARS